MKKALLLFLTAFLAFSGTTFAQRQCGTMDVLQQQIQEDPMLLDRMEQIEQFTEQYVDAAGVHERTVYTIPVVVHVVYNSAVAAENISEAQVLSQINVMNLDFRALNSEFSSVPALFAPVAADAEINFCMAQRTPAGAATNGIERKASTKTSWGTNDSVKKVSQGGLDPWDATKYLNLWVCNIGGGILGYAQFPGGSTATDGVVIDYRYYGTMGTATAPYNLGRTATHEVGHWLNLRHIWGDATCGSDLVNDTPTHNTSNYGCPSYPHYSTCTGTPVEMTMNYMDYTDDPCMYMFTAGQKARMQAVLAAGGARSGLASSLGCQPPSGGTTCGTPTGLNATSVTATTATVNWGSVTGASTYTLQWKASSASTWTTVSGLTGLSYNLSGLTASTAYSYQVQAVCSGTAGTYSTAATFTTSASGGGGGSCTETYESNNTRTTAKACPVNVAFTSQISTSTDLDWYVFGNTSTTKNIKIELTTLPADYDLKLYYGSTLKKTSQNTGTTSETIIYNTTTVASTYYAYVYGYGGAYSNTQCYTLKVSLSSSAWRTDGTTDGEVTEIEVPAIFVDKGFVMFPNPANDDLTIDVFAEADAKASVNILDVNGKTVMTQSQNISKAENRMQFDISNLANGVYFVQLRNGDRTTTQRLVVNK